MSGYLRCEHFTQLVYSLDQIAYSLHGILPVLPTPFTATGNIDKGGMARLVEFAMNAGVSGVVYPGFASEVAELTVAERSGLLEAIARQTARSAPVVAGASAPDAAAVIEHGRFAQSLGLTHLLIQPPADLGRGFEQIIRFFGTVADALPDARIILQNAPPPRGSDLPSSVICRTAAKIPQITYVKEEGLPAGPAVSQLVAEGPPTLKGVIGGGGARYILDEYSRGACGAMPALEIADLHVALDRAWGGGRRDEARAIYIKTLPLLTLQAVYRMRLTKHVLMRRGVLKETHVRAKLPSLDAAAIADINANLCELRLIRREKAA